MNNNKMMGLDYAIADIDEQIEKLYAEKLRIKNIMEQAGKRAEEKRKAKQAEAYHAVEEFVDNYNKKYNGNLVLKEKC